jgi:hypothetical protein
MNTLATRYPTIPRLELDRNHIYQDEELYELVKPFMGWKLLELDSAALDILIGNRQGEPVSKLVILNSRLAGIWLRQSRSCVRAQRAARQV